MSTRSSQGDYPKSDAFSRATKLEVKRLAGGGCWACRASTTQVCQVFGKEDPQMPLWYDANLINFDLTSVDNGIALCPTCHAEFDQTADPGFGLLPTDLQYFVDVELDGRQEQKLAMKNGKDIHRKVPTAEEYKIHQSNNGKVPTDAGGGLYRPIFLKNYLPGGDLSSHMLDTLSAPKQWHGAPVATLRRGILVLGGARVQSLDAETRSQLELLRDLYFLDDEETSPAVRSRQTQGVAQQGQKRPLDNEYGGQNKLSKSSNPAIESGNRRAADEGITLQQCPCGALNVPRRWTLGPGLTADEAVLRYAPLLKDMQSKE
ncbi:hypothetical protein H112_05326 [Trichophyton rubrum D6]|nr:uncharacterized protein TERG_03074 [Trichophyton rubrum CBS 118892]EZF19741.1 hypothetical protein H100_05349 [Trichophyton rubrum MR850]EZF51483.1 hypothetical protein H103_05339 [Trichophyton rubrum CBS 288.86]EZF61987.1 hypothetical protein H104_05328 [Trichophyton rubrum CBS 289.86]EZF72603.1 hypothetical protein H105_05357 [Trichophyton soudanense CBS 452.61]EZF83290.1 hypothetical protein H110_05335 [Trichophyton rubrum MR1448]EZF94028.1 hypothetical protein H113_05374 [Trichophyton 